MVHILLNNTHIMDVSLGYMLIFDIIYVITYKYTKMLMVAMQFNFSHNYSTNSAKDVSDMN